MSLTSYIIVALGYLLVIVSSGLILTPNTIASLTFLLSAFILTSILFFILECELLALLLLILYVGAVVVLLLFASMMLVTKAEQNPKSSSATNRYGGFVLLLTLFTFTLFKLYESRYLLGYSTGVKPINNYQNWFDLSDSTDEIVVLGSILYTRYILEFLVTGIVLLVVIVGVVYLTRSHNKKVRTGTYREISRTAELFAFVEPASTRIYTECNCGDPWYDGPECNGCCAGCVHVLPDSENTPEAIHRAWLDDGSQNWHFPSIKSCQSTNIVSPPECDAECDESKHSDDEWDFPEDHWEYYKDDKSSSSVPYSIPPAEANCDCPGSDGSESEGCCDDEIEHSGWESGEESDEEYLPTPTYTPIK